MVKSRRISLPSGDGDEVGEREKRDDVVFALALVRLDIHREVRLLDPTSRAGERTQRDEGADGSRIDGMLMVGREEATRA